MKIENIKKFGYYEITTDQVTLNTYRRNLESSDWEVLIGESWESLYQSEIMETEFKKFFQIDCESSQFIELDYVDEATFLHTKHVFSVAHYNLAKSITQIPNNINGVICVHPNKKDLVVAFILDEGNNRLEVAKGNHTYRVIIQCPENSNKLYNF